jgi:hypothetical protein
MPAIEQKVITVANNDGAINTEITTQSADGWLVGSITLSGTDVIILFSRTVTEAP